MRNTIFFLFFILGCTSSPKPAAVIPPEPAAEQCAANQFVACRSGGDCTRSRGKHMRTHVCHDRAASACDALSCKHGCNIHHGPIGEPKDVFCSLDTASSSHVWTCGGYSNWACPENMTCEFDKDARHADDATGKCARAAN